MRWRNSIEGYGAVPQMLHWITVALVILAWLLGQFDGNFPKGAARMASLFVHITAGLAAIGSCRAPALARWKPRFTSNVC